LATSGELRRQLGLASATALIVGEVIGVGIFLTPGGMAKALGSPAWLLAVWIVLGIWALSGALCYGELAARFPEAGGSYVYLRQAYGQQVAFLYGWMALLVLDPGLTAALAVGLADYLSSALDLSPLLVKLTAIGVIVGLAAVNMAGVQLGAGVLRWLTGLKVGLLALIALWGFGLRRGDWSNFVPLVEQRPGSPPLTEGLAIAAVSAFFSFAGWWDVSKVGEEVRDPERTLPLALVLGILIVTLVYIVTSAVFLYLVPIEAVTTQEAFAAQAGEALFGKTGGLIFTAVVILAILGTLASYLLAAPRVYYAMARDGVFWTGLARVHPRLGTPARAIALQAALASLLVALGTFDQIVAYFVFATVLFLALSVAALFVLRHRQPGTVSPTPGYPVTPLLFLVLTAGLLALLVKGRPKESLLGAGVVVLGLPIYYLFFRRHCEIAGSTEEKNHDVDPNRPTGAG
jgi:APA family basic amino acid/polyamine antiporter